MNDRGACCCMRKKAIWLTICLMGVLPTVTFLMHSKQVQGELKVVVLMEAKRIISAEEKFEILQKERRMTLIEACDNLKSKPNQKRLYDQFVKSVYDKTFVEDPMRFQAASKFNLVWCKVSKAASSTWAQLFYHMQQPKNSTPVHFSSIPQYHWALKNLTVQQQPFIENALKDLKQNWHQRQPESPWSVIVVRNPWDRIKSAYKNKVARRKKTAYYRKMYPELYNKKSPLGFASFLHILTTKSTKSHVSRPARRGHAKSSPYSIVGGNAHFIPMVGLCDPCKYRFDFIIHVENLQEETTALFNYLNLFNVTVDLMNLNPSSQQSPMSNSRSSLSSNVKRRNGDHTFINDKVIEKEAIDGVKRLYQADFALFGYDDEYSL